MRAKGLGAHVTVTEVNPVRALEAVMDGFHVTNMNEAARQGDIFITVTGGMNAINSDHFPVMKNGAIMANSGHFNVEIDIPSLETQSLKKQTVRPFVKAYLVFKKSTDCVNKFSLISESITNPPHSIIASA